MEGLALETAVVISLIVVVTVALLARRINLPYTLALVVIGLVLGTLDLLPEIELTPDLILLLFLPPLLFEASFNLDVERLRRDVPMITLLAIPGVVLGALMIAGILTWTLDRSFETALVFGALIAATDPVSVLAIFGKLGVPDRLATVVEGESLFNDGVAIVLFGIVLEMATGDGVSITEGIADFLVVAVGGALLGLLVGFFAAELLRRIDDHLIEITITTIVAFGTFSLAETLHVSGVIGVVAAGLFIGHLHHESMSPTTRIALSSFWEYVAFLGNSMIFLLIGVRVAAPALWDNVPTIGLVMLVVVASRIVIVALVNGTLQPFSQHVPWHWVPVMTWGGLRGAVSLALALSIPTGVEERGWIQVMAFGVVLLSLVGQGLTMGPLLTWLGFSQEEPYAYERHLARMQALGRAIEVIDRERRQGNLLPDVAETITADYQRAIVEEQEAIKAMGVDASFLREQQLVRARRQTLNVQRDVFRRLHRRGHLSSETMEELINAIDSELVEVEEHVAQQDLATTADAARGTARST